MSSVPPQQKNYIVESDLNSKEIEIGTTAESLELRFRIYLYLITKRNKDRNGKVRCHGGGGLKVALDKIYMQRTFSVQHILARRHNEMRQVLTKTTLQQEASASWPVSRVNWGTIALSLVQIWHLPKGGRCSCKHMYESSQWWIVRAAHLSKKTIHLTSSTMLSQDPLKRYKLM